MELPQNIRDIFFKTIEGEIPIVEFEQWVYAQDQLEGILGPDPYLNLISLNYKKSGAKYELWNLLTQHISLGEFETYKMLGLLQEAQNRTERLPFILMEFYKLYCRGYGFLRILGLVYGLAVEVPLADNWAANSWEKLAKNQQQEMLDSFYPDLDAEIKRVEEWIISKKIILTGIQDELGHYDYEDYRTEEERES